VKRRLRFRGFTSFRARIFWSVVPIVVSFLVFQGWMNLREHRRLVTEEFEKRGRALASNLGFASELGAFSEDKELLAAAMRGALRNPDVASRWSSRSRGTSNAPPSGSSNFSLRSCPSRPRRLTSC
jgi:hypothetical protein